MHSDWRKHLPAVLVFATYAGFGACGDGWAAGDVKSFEFSGAKATMFAPNFGVLTCRDRASEPQCACSFSSLTM
jgi:hypothetical protein